MNLIAEMLDWLQSLPADFAFLLALPFAVGAAGLAAEWYRGRGKPRPTVLGGTSRAAPLRERVSPGLPR